MKLFKFVFMIFAIGTLAACVAGTNFVKPSDDKVVINKSTKGQVLSLMGDPNGKGEKMVNGETLELVTYAYANVTGQAVFEGVTPARAITFYFHNNVLVGKEFTSSFKTDSTYFDKEATKLVKKGMSKADVVKSLGKAGGEFRYPMISEQNGKALVYSFTQTRGFSSQITIFIVELDESGKVVKSEFNQHGAL